jgi:hypothetical protein
VSITIDDPGGMQDHGAALVSHADAVTDAAQQLAAAMGGDDGLGGDGISQSIRAQLSALTTLHQSLAGSADGVRGIGQNVRQMGADYLAADHLGEG